MPATGVHFNGSVNLADTDTVLREIAARTPAGLRRIPDGETGDRANWVFYQWQKFGDLPTLEWSAPPGEGYEGLPQLRLAGGASASDVEWPDLGYAAEYQQSYDTFRRLQDDGVVPAGARFQVQYPTPLASMSVIDPEQQAELAASYETALFADLATLLDAVPHERVAVQWDVAVEFGVLSGGFPAGPSFEDVIAALIRCVETVPPNVPVGLHLCYGDYEHHHFAQPESLQLQVRVANAVTDGAGRTVDWFSFTVPQNRADEAYFEPLRLLDVGPQTELDFALVPYHPDDQPAGTTERQSAAIDRYLGESPAGARDWGVCTECGMGRVEREDVPRLLDLHAQIAGDL